MDTDNRKSIKEAATTEPKTTKKAKEAKPAESVYTAKELAEAHKFFGTTYEIVAVALKLAKKEKATLKETEKLIEEFKNKEVK